MKHIQDLFRGCLIGGAAGDALGYAIEFYPWSSIKKKYGVNGITQYECDGLNGKASISDDTQMTLFTATGILVGRNKIRKENINDTQQSNQILLNYIYLAYLDWLSTQLQTKSKNPISWLLDVPEMHQWQAPGNTCLSALRSGIMGSIEEPINNSKGCGGVMRVAPLGLFCTNPEQIENTDLLGAKAAAITHGNSLGYIPAAALVHIINRIVYGGCTKGDSLYDIVEECKETLSILFDENGLLKSFLTLVDKAVAFSKNSKSDLQNIAKLGEGWIGDEAFAIALYCVLKYQTDFSKVIIAAVNHDGDSDSTGAIAGNMAGALIGYEAIPQQWKNDLELHEVTLLIADDLYEYATGNSAYTM